MKKGKSVLFALLVGAVALTSCNKEKSLANKLEDKWNITEWSAVKTGTTTEYKTDGTVDTTYNPYAPNANYSVTETTTGTLDFVSEDNVIIETTTVTKTSVTSNGATTTTENTTTSDWSAEYFATGEEEVTLIMSNGDYVVFDITTNEKDAQTWVNVDEDTDIDYYGSGAVEEKTVTTTTTTVSMTKIED